MAAKWDVSGLVQESTSMASLVSARNDCPRMAASLVKQWLLKLKGATLSATDLVPLTQHLEQLTLPEGSKQSVLEAVDELVISGGNLQSSMKLTQMPQKHDFIHNYLTQNDWNTLHTQGLWAGVKTLVARLRKIGVNSCKEGIKRQVLAILVMIECQQRKMPPYEEIYELGDHFSQAFNASSYRCAQGVPSLAEYPENPEQVGPNFVSLAYPAGEPPVAKHLEDINYIAWNHIPLRDTSKLLKKNQKKKNGTRRRYKDECDDDDEDDDDDCQRAHILLKKAKELMNSDDGDLALALKAEKFKPKRFKALPSQSSFSFGSGAAGSAQASPTPSQVPMQFGLLLPGPDGSSLKLFFDLQVLLQDGGSHKYTWSNKGDAGLKPCLLCNVQAGPKGGDETLAEGLVCKLQNCNRCSKGDIVLLQGDMVQAAQVFAFVAVPGHVLCLLQYLDVENCNLETASANCTLSPTKDLVSVEYLEASDEMWYAEEVSVSCAATTTVDAAGIAVYANGAKTLFLYSLGMAIYSWLF
ncbi:unnamed protein product [Cladocopium goreaui]|uniref:Uncharacterized protein n=1 Tax=Cladocopium goreaui TaxID=2562237 RepID=A0A9P1BM03_9DINO|nr:unnamed protein product [Cladocopium goreaui]